MRRRRPNLNAINAVDFAREEDHLLSVSGYCDSSGCPGRTTSAEAKDYDRELVALLRERGGPFCMFCGGPLSLIQVKTRVAHEASAERAARFSVNFQMLRRDHRQACGDALFAVAASQLCDDRLPPTPPDWFTKR